MIDELPEPTPEYKTKPMLVYLCKFLGMDLYIDLRGQRDPEAIRNMAEKVFKDIITPK